MLLGMEADAPESAQTLAGSINSESVGKPAGYKRRAPPGREESGDVTSRRTRFFINETGRRGRMRGRPPSLSLPPPLSQPLSISSSLVLPLPGRWKGSHFRWGVMAASRTVMAVGTRR